MIKIFIKNKRRRNSALLLIIFLLVIFVFSFFYNLTSAVQWNINPTTADVSYVDVGDSNNTSGTTICAAYSQSTAGNNTDWNIQAGSCAGGLTISGRVCSAESCNDTNGSGACATANVVGLSVNGGSPSYASCNTTTGAYSFSNVTAASGASIALFLNDNATDASAIIVSNNANVTDADFYDNTVVVRSQTGTINIADMMDYDSDQQPGDIRFDAETGTLNVEAGHELHVWTSDTFAPGGTVTLTAGSGSDLHIDDNAVFTAGGAISIGGSWTADTGTTFTHNNNNVTFTAGVSGQTITTNGQNFYNLIFNGSGGVWTAQDAMTVGNDLTITSGNFDTGAVTNAITGATSVTGTLTISSATGTKTFTGDVTINAGGLWNETAAEDISFGGSLTNNNTFTASTGVHTFTGTGKSINGTVSIPNLTISGTTTNNDTLTVSTALSGASTLTNAATGTLNIGGTSAITGLTATASGNTVNYNGTGQTVKPVSYHHLTLSNSGAKTMTSVTTIGGDLTISGTATMTSNAAFTVTGALNYSSSGSTTLTASTAVSIGKYNQSAGTIIDNGNTITVTGTGASTWVKSGGTFTATGTATFTGAAPGIGASNFNNFIINVGGGNTATLEGAITVGNNLTISSGILDVSATDYGITVSGNWDNNGTFTRRTGTVTFGAGWSYKKSLTLTASGSDLTNYQVKFDIYSGTGTDGSPGNEDIYCENHCQSDFDDIRFTDANGNQIDYWRETSTSPATFWVEVPTISTGGTIIYMLYGNDSASTTSSVANTFIREISGVQGSWNMDETSWTQDCSTLTVDDASGNTNDGKSCPSTTGPTTTASGKWGYGGLFDGSNDYVDAGQGATLNITSAITIEAWINPTSITGQHRVIARKASSYYFRINTDDNKLETYLYGTSSPGYHKSTGTIPTGTWTHVAMTYNGSNVILYINGTSTSYEDTGSITSNTNATLIGAETATTQRFYGTIDEAHIYNAALSSVEINDIKDNYGYVTTNYSNKVLVRKRASTEPTKSGWSAETVRTIADGGSAFYNIVFDDSGAGPGNEWLYQDGSVSEPNQTTVTNGTATFLNTKTGASPSIAAGGTLNVDWYLGIHVVNLNGLGNIQTDNADDITISENTGSPASTVWKYNSGWGPGTEAASQTTGTNSSGVNIQPNTDGAIKIREYKNFAGARTDYYYNLQIDWQTNYGAYDYYEDYTGAYMTSSLNGGTIGSGWHRAAPISTMNADGTLNGTTSTGTWYVGMLTGLSVAFTTGDSITFDNLNSANNFSDTDETKTRITVSTSATNGYVVTAWEDGLMTCTACPGTPTIQNFYGTYAVPQLWGETSYCKDNSNYCGFGFTSDDATIDTFGDLYVGATKYAGFPNGSTNPIRVMDYDDPANGIFYDITYRISVSETQQPGSYSTAIVYVVTAKY